MLFPQRFFDGMARGEITLAFRRWLRPTVKTGGTLTTAIGVLSIDAVEVITLQQIDETAARNAGYASKDELLAALARNSERTLYRVRFHLAGEDPRVALRNNTVFDLDELRARLDRMGAWAHAALRMIGEQPGTRAPELAALAGVDTLVFKNNVRKLKGLGLTESLNIGYRLSPRGAAFLSRAGVVVVVRETVCAPAPPGAIETAQDALSFIETRGVVMHAAEGPVPTLTWEIAGEPVKKSWLGHARAPVILEISNAIAKEPAVLACRLYQAKKCFVHRRLWPHLACLSPRLPEEACAVVEEEQSARGAFRVRVTPLLEWLPDEVLELASSMSEEEALDGLGWWVLD